MKKLLALSCFSMFLLLACSPVAEARGRVFFGFSVGVGGGYYAPYYPGYYYPAPYAVYSPYYYPYYYYPAPVVSYYGGPYWGGRVHRGHAPIYRHTGRGEGHYGPRHYYRHR